MDHKKVIRNLVSLLGVQGVNYVFPLLSVAVVARALGADQLGLLILAQAICMYVQQATDFGFNLTATRRVALTKGSQAELNKVYTATILAKVVAFLLASLVFVLVSCVVESVGQSFELVAVLLIGVFASIFYPIWLFQGMEQMQNIFFGNFVTKASSLTLMLLLVHGPDDLYLAAFIQSLSWCFVGLYSLVVIFLKGYCRFTPVRIEDIRQSLSESFYIYLSVLATSFYTLFNLIVLGYLSSALAIAIYGLADKLRQAAQSFIGVFAQALYPQFCMRPDGSMFAFRLSLIVGVLSGLGFYFIAPVVVILLYGEEYLAAVRVVEIFSILCPIMAISNYYSKLKLASNGYHKLFLNVYLGAAFLHMTYVHFLTISYDYIGLSISLVMTEGFIALLMYMVSKRVTR